MSCCGCLDRPARITNLFRHDELSTKYTDLTEIIIRQNLFICDSCIIKLETAFEFKQKCINIFQELTEESIADTSSRLIEQNEEDIIVYEDEIHYLDDPLVKIETSEYLTSGPDEEEDEELENLNQSAESSSRCRSTYTPGQKFEAVQLAEATSNRQAARKLSIDESSVRRWRNKKQKDKKNPTLKHSEIIQTEEEVSSATEQKSEINKVVKSRKSYSCGQKLEVISYAEVTGNRQASRVFSIDESCIRKWRQQKDLIIEISKERGTKRKPNLHWAELDRDLKTWVFSQMDKGILLKPRQIKAHSMILARNLKLDNFKGTSSYIFKFMERYHIPGRQPKTSSLIN